MKLNIQISAEGNTGDVTAFLRYVSGYTPNASTTSVEVEAPKADKPVKTDEPDAPAVEEAKAPDNSTDTPDKLPDVTAPAAEQVQTGGTLPPSVDLSQGLDARGLPWDGRIHTPAQTKIANGNWKNIRGVDKDLLARVEAELSSRDWVALTSCDNTPQSTEQAPEPAAEQSGGSAAFGQSEQPAPSASDVVSLAQFNQAIMKGIQAGTILREDVNENLKIENCADMGEFLRKADDTARARFLSRLGV